MYQIQAFCFKIGLTYPFREFLKNSLTIFVFNNLLNGAYKLCYLKLAARAWLVKKSTKKYRNFYFQITFSI